MDPNKNANGDAKPHIDINGYAVTVSNIDAIGLAYSVPNFNADGITYSVTYSITFPIPDAFLYSDANGDAEPESEPD